MSPIIKTDCVSCLNRDCSLLKYCNSEWLDIINKNKVVIKFKAGQQIVYEKTPANQIYFIYSGKVKIYKTGFKGKQHILRLANEGDVVGYRGFNRKCFPISVAALEDTVVCGVSMMDFTKLLASNPKLTHKMLLIFADELFDSDDREKVLGQLSVREKVADALLRIKAKFNSFDTGVGLGVKMTRQEIGDLAGTTKEQVSKYLADFKEEGWVELEGKIIRISDEEMLRLIAGYFPDKQLLSIQSFCI